MLFSKLKIVGACLLLIAIAGLFAVQVVGEPGADSNAPAGTRVAANAGAVSLKPGQPDQAVAKKKARIYLHASLKVKRAGDEDAQNYRGIIAMDPDTGKWQKITGEGHNPRISPDGETVIFAKLVGGVDGFADSVLWNCDTGGTDNPGKISEIGGVPSWSPDGKFLVVNKGKFENKAWSHQTFRIDANGNNPKELPIPKTDEVDDWSPDGKWFVTVSDRHPPHGHAYQLYVMHPDGTEERRLTKDGLNCYPRFSPDSRKIVFIHQTAKEGNSLWMVDVDGKNARAILKEENLVAPDFACWSPDGKRLAVIGFQEEQGDGGRTRRAGAECHLEIMDLDGQNRRRVTLADATIVWLGHGDWR
jgi:Tol biopolymer transport system component